MIEHRLRRRFAALHASRLGLMPDLIESQVVAVSKVGWGIEDEKIETMEA